MYGTTLAITNNHDDASGSFIIVNKYLVKELVKSGIWSEAIRRKIMTENGSIQNIPEIPTGLKEIFNS